MEATSDFRVCTRERGEGGSREGDDKIDKGRGRNRVGEYLQSSPHDPRLVLSMRPPSNRRAINRFCSLPGNPMPLPFKGKKTGKETKVWEGKLSFMWLDSLQHNKFQKWEATEDMCSVVSGLRLRLGLFCGSSNVVPGAILIDEELEH